MTRITHHPQLVHGSHHHRMRMAAAAGAAALVAAGGYGLAQELAPDTAPVARGAAAGVHARDLTAIRDSLARQYGSAPARGRAPTSAQASEMRERLAQQYGARR